MTRRCRGTQGVLSAFINGWTKEVAEVGHITHFHRLVIATHRSDTVPHSERGM